MEKPNQTDQELIECLKKKLFESRKKSAARKTALKELQKAYTIMNQALRLSVTQNIKIIKEKQELYKQYCKLEDKKTSWWRR